MIEKIIAASDIHIKNVKRFEEYKSVLEKFIKDCTRIKNETKGDIRIVIAGDLLHNKLDISSEAYVFASWFINKLGEIAPTIIIGGNHDFNMANLERLDPITGIFKMSKPDNVTYLDMELDYESGCLVDDNVVWCLYSAFDSFKKPNINEYKINNPDATYIALYHGVLTNAKTDVGFVFDNGIDASYFNDTNFGIIGHIHKRQEINYNGTKLVYCGSMIQQEHGENVTGHGYVIWDVNAETYEQVDIENNNYGYYTFSIDDITDIDNDKERLLNL